MKLNDCPFCDASQEDGWIVDDECAHCNKGSVKCKSCGARGPTKRTKEQAGKAWNDS